MGLKRCECSNQFESNNVKYVNSVNKPIFPETDRQNKQLNKLQR